MSSNSIRPAIEELERAYKYLNKHYALNLPDDCVITIQGKGRGGSEAWYGNRFWAEGKKELHEINICAELLTRGDPYEKLAHEMAHHKNAVAGVKDCNANQYHNRKFKEAAEALGLTVSTLKGKGYAITNAPQQFLKDLDVLFKPKREVFNLFRTPRKLPAAKGRMKKWTCGCTTVRCATELEATCDKCSNAFDEVKTREDPGVDEETEQDEDPDITIISDGGSEE